MSVRQIGLQVCFLTLLLSFMCWNMAYAQQTVSGTVTDASTSETLSGVNISVKSTTTGTSTNSKGAYGLTVPTLQDTLVFSFVGYQTQQIPINGRTSIDVTMQVQAISGQEMVVVGYGTQKRSNLTESVSEINGDELARRPNPNLTESLQGKIPGLNISTTTGKPGSKPRINIRGFTSINGGNPLVLIDGVQRNINDINPQDVESVTVLKDAAATSIYGSRGSYGVILVTTKEPKSGDIKVQYGNSLSWKTSTVRTDFNLDPYKAAMLEDKAYNRNVGGSATGYTQKDYGELKKRSDNPSLPNVITDVRNGKEQYIYYGNTDWWKTLFRNWRPTQTHHVSISGGSKQLQAYLSGRLYNEIGLSKIQKDTYKKYNLSGKVHYNAQKWLIVSDDFYMNSNNQLVHGGGDSGFSTLWENVNSGIYRHLLPFNVPTNPDGTATYQTGLSNYTVGGGVVAQLLQGKSKRITDQQLFSNTIQATIKPWSHVDLKTKYTTQWSFLKQGQRSTKAPHSIYPGIINYLGQDELSVERTNNIHRSLRIYANYNQSLNKNNFQGKIGLDYEREKNENLSASENDLLSNDLNQLVLGTTSPQNYSSASRWVTLGYFMRLNYNYDQRYMLELNGRYDGTSRFLKNNRWGFFPSASIGYLVSEENFMTKLKNVVNRLKIRISYGSVGNQQVNTYAYIPTLSKNTNGSYLINGEPAQYVSAPGLNPRNITWEKVNTANVGIDLALLHNSITANFDLFQRETIGMLTKGKTLPAVIGATPPRENAANLRSQGFEIKLSYHKSFQVSGKPFNLKLTGTLSNQIGKITKYDNPNNFIGDYYEGQTLGDIWGYHIDGLYRSDEAAAKYANKVDLSQVNGTILGSPGEWGKLRAGDVKYVDLNGNGVVNNGDNTVQNPGDRRIIGNAAPKFPYSFTLSAKWNQIDFSAFFQGVGKQVWYPDTQAWRFWNTYNVPYSSFVRKDLLNNMWTEDNPNGYYPRLRGYSVYGGELGHANNRYLQNVAYLRLKNLTIGYTFPLKLTQKLHINQIRIHVSGENLLTFSSLTDYIDPEVASSSFNFAQAPISSDLYSSSTFGRAEQYPISKIYSFGINIDF